MGLAIPERLGIDLKITASFIEIMAKESKPIVRQMYRSKDNRIIAGVCAGIAEYAELDPTLVRLLWAGITIFTAVIPGVLVYLIAWIIMPEKR